MRSQGLTLLSSPAARVEVASLPIILQLCHDLGDTTLQLRITDRPSTDLGRYRLRCRDRRRKPSMIHSPFLSQAEPGTKIDSPSINGPRLLMRLRRPRTFPINGPSPASRKHGRKNVSVRSGIAIQQRHHGSQKDAVRDTYSENRRPVIVHSEQACVAAVQSTWRETLPPPLARTSTTKPPYQSGG